MKTLFKTSAAALALASFALVGCAPTDTASDTTTGDAPVEDAAAAPGNTVVFECPGGETITAEFMGMDEAVVTLPDQDPITLAATEAASGARYSDGTTTFWNKGEEAMVEVNDEVVLSECMAQS